MSDQAFQAWADEIKKLPKERQKAVEQWYGVQAYMAVALGLKVEEWMEYVQWAFAHPFDYSFIADFPELASALAASDGFELAQSSSSLLGQTPPTFSTSAPKSGNSLFDLMLGRPAKSGDAEKNPNASDANDANDETKSS